MYCLKIENAENTATISMQMSLIPSINIFLVLFCVRYYDVMYSQLMGAPSRNWWPSVVSLIQNTNSCQQHRQPLPLACCIFITILLSFCPFIFFAALQCYAFVMHEKTIPWLFAFCSNQFCGVFAWKIELAGLQWIFYKCNCMICIK